MKLHFKARNKTEQIILKKLKFLFRLINFWLKICFYYKKLEKLLKNKLIICLLMYITKSNKILFFLSVLVHFLFF